MNPAQLMQFLSSPPIAMDLALATHFPDIHAEMQQWAGETKADFGAVYDFIQRRFPNALVRTIEDKDVDFLYRELTKCIIAQALRIDYKPVRKIMIAH